MSELLTQLSSIPLPALTVLIALCGGMLLLILLSGVITSRRNRNLQRYRSTDEGLNDRLNYSSIIEDGIILCKSGALMAAWRYRAADAEDHIKRLFDQSLGDA